MINIIIPLALKKLADENSLSQYPLPLLDIKGKPLIEYVLDNLNKIKEDKKFIFIVNDDDCQKYHIDNMLKLLVTNSSIIKVKGSTKGAICSILMAIDHIDKDENLVIVNSDQVIDCDYNKVLNEFRSDHIDGGVITFQSVHPRSSFVKIVEGLVIQTAEKNPISNHAIAGFYYFKKGIDFINGAFNIIKFDDNYNGNYFTSAVYNQLILAGKKIKIYQIQNEEYHSFYSTQKLKEFEEHLNLK
jgi:dTDP-glucose pyrophosphorylase